MKFKGDRKMKKFEIDASKIKAEKNNGEIEINPPLIKCAGSEFDVSHTIEELLSLNDLLGERTDRTPEQESSVGITEKQLEKNDFTTFNEEPNKYTGEIVEITERQLGDRKDDIKELVETRFNEEGDKKPGSGIGHRETWNEDNSEHRGHKDVPPIWQEVYRIEDERKKLDKGQMEKKVK